MEKLTSKLTPKQIGIINGLNQQRQIWQDKLDEVIGFIAASHDIELSQVERSEIINDEFVITLKS